MLTALARIGKILVKRGEIVECALNLRLGKRRILGTAHGKIRCDLTHLVERIRTDKLALAVEVCGDDHGIGFFSQVLERANELLLCRNLDDGSPCQVRQALELPSLDGNAVGEKRLAL